MLKVEDFCGHLARDANGNRKRKVAALPSVTLTARRVLDFANGAEPTVPVKYEVHLHTLAHVFRDTSLFSI